MCYKVDNKRNYVETVTNRMLSNAFLCRKPLLACVEKQLVEVHLTTLLQKGNICNVQFVVDCNVWIVCCLLTVIFKLWQLVGLLMFCICCLCWLGLDQLLEENRTDDLALLYQLVSHVHNGPKELNASFASYIKVWIILCSLTCSDYQRVSRLDHDLFNWTTARLFDQIGHR